MNYIGSKHSIINFLEESIIDFTNKEGKVFCDIFAGTGVVGKRFKQLGYNIIANDTQFYSFVLNKHYLENNNDLLFSRLKLKGIQDVFIYLNKLNNYQGFIYNNYTTLGTLNDKYERNYFTIENAIKIDSMRDQIEKWYKKEYIEKNEYYYLLACLIEAADKVANTASVYEAFLKNMKKSAQKTIEIKPLDIIVNKNTKSKVYIEDSNELINIIKGDILYLDPPYNSRRYSSNYHILETIAYGDSPIIKGKTGIRKESINSKYNKKNEVAKAFEELIANAKFKYIFLSYNDEGIMNFKEIEEIMSKYGEYKRYETNHKRYKASKNKEVEKKTTIEYLHALKKRDNEYESI